MKNLDQSLGRLLWRFFAVLAFLAFAGCAVFGAIVLRAGHFPGILVWLLGALFLWLGRRAWREKAGLGESLNRDFAPMARSSRKSPGDGEKPRARMGR
jgi:hypothetical protein